MPGLSGRPFSLLTAAVLFTASAFMVLLPAAGHCDHLPAPGDTLPAVTFPAPPHPGDGAELGIGDASSFTLESLGAKVILLEVIGVYCAQCYKQLPDFNKMYRKLEKQKLLGKVRMFALAAGGTVPEVNNLRKSRKYLFPIIADEDYALHKLLKEPQTPFTLILSPDGKVLYSHLGVISDTDAVLNILKQHAE